MWTFTNDKRWSALTNHFPEIQDMAGVVQDPCHHAEGDVAIHTQMVLASLTEQPDYKSLPVSEQEIVWTATLLHDVEKRSTTVVEPDGTITSKGHARRGERTARELLYVADHLIAPAPFFERKQICKLVRYHSLPLWIFEKPDPLKTLLQVSLEVNTHWLTMLARADVRGRICIDQVDLLYRVDLFEEFCRENECWGQAHSFVSPAARFHYFSRDDAHPDYEPFGEPPAKWCYYRVYPVQGRIRSSPATWPIGLWLVWIPIGGS
ncbi:hypothetical protein [Spirosoma telluris]|uniref:hypothetical protein n=1 Tax=Spirosoma telluris TaxID=2183553 RepID=UPI002FC3D561